MSSRDIMTTIPHSPCLMCIVQCVSLSLDGQGRILQRYTCGDPAGVNVTRLRSAGRPADTILAVGRVPTVCSFSVIMTHDEYD